MRITIHRGTHEIGGNCIEVETDRSRIILDVGLPLFNKNREPYDSSMLRRQTSEQLRASEILPNVPGLFDKTSTRPDAILLSHAHEDHTGLLRSTSTDIPIYASVGTSKMMLAGAKFAGQPSLPSDRYHELKSGTTVPIGEFLVTSFSVDHSIYGAQAFVIESDGKSILYSGDLRLHGRKPGMHRSLIEAAQHQRLDVLLMEGTHLSHREHRAHNEYELEREILGHVQSAPSLVLASFSPQHVDRLVGFYKATVKAGRIFVADAYTAFVMHLIASEIPIPRPESSAEVKVFFPRFFEENYQQKQLERHFLLMSPARIGMEEIRTNPYRYVMVFRPSMLNSDFGGNLPEASRCLYSRWEGYVERPDWQLVKAKLTNRQGELIHVHTSGHIFADDITEFVRQINPKLVVPIHTFEPELFRSIATSVRILTDGEPMEVS